METTFCELRAKEVINIVDGKRMGHIVDIVFDLYCGRLLGLVVPGCKKGFFRGTDDIYIPFQNVCKIGKDVILVEVFVNTYLPNNCGCCSTQSVKDESVKIDAENYSYVRPENNEKKNQ